MKTKVAYGELKMGLRKEFGISTDQFLGMMHDSSILEASLVLKSVNGEVHTIEGIFPDIQWETICDIEDDNF